MLHTAFVDIAAFLLRPYAHGDNPTVKLAWIGALVCVAVVTIRLGLHLDRKMYYNKVGSSSKVYEETDRFQTMFQATLLTGGVYWFAVYGLHHEKPKSLVVAVMVALLFHLAMCGYGIWYSDFKLVMSAFSVAIIADVNILSVLLGNAKPYGSLRPLLSGAVAVLSLAALEIVVACLAVAFMVMGVICIFKWAFPDAVDPSPAE